MIHLSANGEILGEFAEDAVPALLADGTISDAAFYWREGMSEWLPVGDLPKPKVATPLPPPESKPPGPVERQAAIASALRPEPHEKLPLVKGAAPASTSASAPAGAGISGGAVSPAGKPVPRPVATVKLQGKATEPKTLGHPQPVSLKPEVVLPAAGEAGKKSMAARQAPVHAAAGAGVLNRTGSPIKMTPIKMTGEISDRAPTVVGQAPSASAHKSLSGRDMSEPKVSLPGAPLGEKKPFVPRLGPSAVPPPKTLKVQPEAPAMKEVAPGGLSEEKAADGKRPLPESAALLPAGAAATVVPRKKGRGWLVWLAGLLLFGAVAGGGVWWWMAHAESPVIPGTVVLAGDESGPVEIRVFRREELVAPWRERLSVADARAAEFGGLITEAQALLREKSLLRDEVARVLEVGEEYNMPDVEELRADREAKQADADAAQAEVAKLEAEKASLLTFEGLLENMPAPLQTVVADVGGVFSLPPPGDEEVVLLAMTTVESGGQRQTRAWLEVLEVPADGAAPDAVRFSEMNRLDLDEIRRLASAGAP